MTRIQHKRAGVVRVGPTLHRLNGEISVSGALSSADEIRELGRLGYRSMVDLRGAGELVTGLSPAEERLEVEACGLSDRCIPVALWSLGSQTIIEVRLALWAADAPLLLHCDSGRRASLCALVHIGCQQGWTLEQCLAVDREHGLEVQATPKLRDFLSDYMPRHSRAYMRPVQARRDRPQLSYHI